MGPRRHPYEELSCYITHFHDIELQDRCIPCYCRDVDVDTVTQLVTVALAVFAIIWHQQRSTDKLRGDFERAHDKMRDGLDEVKQRLSRIEGFLGIGMPTTTASEAPGTAWRREPPKPSEPK